MWHGVRWQADSKQSVVGELDAEIMDVYRGSNALVLLTDPSRRCSPTRTVPPCSLSKDHPHTHWQKPHPHSTALSCLSASLRSCGEQEHTGVC